jgi:uncharacterized protein
MTAVTLPSRIITLDTVRGVAVMGILAMNIVAFALPEQAYFNPEALGPASPADLASWFASFVLFDGKMRGLFSLLFGASMLLVIERAEAAGLPSHAIHFRRMAWLLVFGLAHFYLVWEGDILALYAATGMAAWFFCEQPPAALLRTALFLFLAELLVMGVAALAYFDAHAAAVVPGAGAETVETWRVMASSLAPLSAERLDEALALYRGSWSTITGYRLAEQGSMPFTAMLWFGCETLAYMLLGMAALKTGFLRGEWPLAAYRRAAWAGLGFGIAGFALLGWIMLRTHFAMPLLFALAVVAPIALRPPMVLAIAAAIILATRRGGWLATRIAAAGRAAFTNYLGASLVMTALFYGYGFGLYGKLGRAELWLVVLAAWAAMLLWSKPWLDRYLYGPFEWLWRTLARGALQPMRRAMRDATE